MINDNKTFSLSILSGKGGVGKTNLALNLGFALHAFGQPTMLMDCDLGLANLDVLLGISPDKNFQDLIEQDARPEDILVALESDGLDVMPAASGVPELVEMDEDMQAMLFDKLKDLVNKYHFLILDLGAGITSTVLSFASMTQARLLVITPEPTSLTDGYAMIKVLSAQYGVRDFCVIVNQASSQKEAKETFKRLDMACRKFLDIEITGLGSVSQDESMIEAVRNQVPLLKFAPGCRASQDISSLAKKLLRYRQDNEEAISGRPALKNFPSLETRR